MKGAGKYVTGINVVVLIVVLNIVAGVLRMPQLDLTKARVHSLSPGTREMVKNLDDLVGVKVYVGTEVPEQIRPLVTDLKLMLSSIERINPGKFKVEYADPSKDETALAEAEKYGIMPFQFSSVKNDKFEVQQSYLGMVMRYGGKDEVIPVASDVGNLEYMIASSIKRMTARELAEVLLYEPAGEQSQIQLLKRYLQLNYRVSEARLDDAGYQLPSEASVLVIAGTTGKFDQKIVEQIEAWVNGGKALAVFDDRVAVNGNMQASKKDESGLEKMLAEKGIEIESKLVMDKSGTIANFRTNSGTFLSQYVYWPQIRPENINSQIPINSGISNLMLAWASPLKLGDGAESLFKTSTESGVDLGFEDLSPQTQTLKGEIKQYDLAAVNIREAKIGVIGDEDLIRDQFVTNNQSNLLLALNMIDYLSNDSSLLQIRGKNIASSPIIEVSDGVKGIIRVSNLAVPMIMLIVVYLMNYGVNKRKNNQIVEKMAN